MSNINHRVIDRLVAHINRKISSEKEKSVKELQSRLDISEKQFSDILFKAVEKESSLNCDICKTEFNSAYKCVLHLIVDHRMYVWPCTVFKEIVEANCSMRTTEADETNNANFIQDDTERKMAENWDDEKKVLQSKAEAADRLKIIYYENFQNWLIRDVKGAYYSIIIDRCEFLNTNILVLLIRHFSKQERKIITTFYRLIEMEDRSVNIVYCIINTLKKDGFNLSYFIGLGINSVNIPLNSNRLILNTLHDKRLKVIVNRCSLKTVESLISDAAKELPSNFAFLVKETYKWFNDERRMRDYKIVYEILNQSNYKKLVETVDEEWLSKTEYLNVITENWDSFLLHFKNVSQHETDSVTLALSKEYENSINQLHLKFIQKSIYPLQTLIDCLREETSFDPTMVYILYHDICTNIKFSQADNLRYDYTECKAFINTLHTNLNTLIPIDVDILCKISLFLQKNIEWDDLMLILERFGVHSNLEKSIDEWLTIQKFEPDLEETIEQHYITMGLVKDKPENSVYTEIPRIALLLLSLPTFNPQTQRLFSLFDNADVKNENICSVELLNIVVYVHYKNFFSNSNRVFVDPRVDIKQLNKLCAYLNSISENNESLDCEIKALLNKLQ